MKRIKMLVWAGLLLTTPAAMVLSGCNGSSGGLLGGQLFHPFAGVSASGPVTDSNNNLSGTVNFTVDNNGAIAATFNVLRALTIAPREAISGTGQVQSNGAFTFAIDVPTSPAPERFTFSGTLPQHGNSVTASYNTSTGRSGSVALTVTRTAPIPTATPTGGQGNCAAGGATDAPANAIPASMQGTHALTFHEANAGAGIANGTQTQFTLTADTLQFNGKTLRNPIFRNGNQLEWIFCDGNLEYAASIATDNSLNEINVGGSNGSGGSTFFGQYNDRP